MTLKDAFFDPKGNKEIKNDEIVLKEDGEKEVPTLHTKYDLFNIGSNVHNSAIVGSSVLTMQIDIPAFMTKLDAINDITTNAVRIKKKKKKRKRKSRNFTTKLTVSLRKSLI